ncbi:MAG TPA: cupin domain-containing protein [Xanthobacteraceae bacterium]|nr:cupin domain-containing protein [Xanthobacteraceae bacterium]
MASDRPRRIVTSHASDGRAIVHIDESEPLEVVDPVMGVKERVFWVTEQMPVDLSGKTDAGKIKVGIPPPQNGTIFRFVEFAPESDEARKLPPDYLSKLLGDGHMKGGLPTKHASMHRTRTVDYIIILSGEIDMVLDDSEVHLKPGDVVVQQGTNHAWVNRGKEPCRIAAILVDAKPL